MRRLLMTVLTTVALLLTAAAVPAQAYEKRYGHNARGDGVLIHGCHLYRYRYVLHPHAQDWYVEIFLKGPAGRTLGNDLFQKGDRPQRGHGHFKICSGTTQPGRFRIRTKIHRYHDVCATPVTCTSKQFDQVWIKPAVFRLRHP
jgi:hypothetical protein